MLVRDSLAPHVNVKVFVRTQQTAGMQIICTMTISEMTLNEIKRQVNNLSFSFLPSFQGTMNPYCALWDSNMM